MDFELIIYRTKGKLSTRRRDGTRDNEKKGWGLFRDQERLWSDGFSGASLLVSTADSDGLGSSGC